MRKEIINVLVYMLCFIAVALFLYGFLKFSWLTFKALRAGII